MRVLVFEHCLKVTGHRLPYAAEVAKALAETGCEVVLGLPSSVQSFPEASNYLNSTLNVNFYDVVSEQGSFRQALEAHRCLVQLVKDVEPDYVAIPTADGLALVAGMLHRFWPFFSGLKAARIDICLMRGRKLYERRSVKQLVANLKWWFIRQGPWQRILLIDPREWSTVKNANAKGVFLCPDPVPAQKFFQRDEARKTLGLPVDGRLLVSVGAQNIRKGSDYLLEGFSVANLNPNDRLLMFGGISPEIGILIDACRRRSGMEGRIIVRDEFVSEDEFQMAIVAGDAVAVPYRSVNRPSGIVCRSMAWQRPLVMTERGWLKWVLEKFQAGFGGHPEDSTQFSKTIEQALDYSQDFESSEKAAKFVAYNTLANYKKVWKNGLDAETENPLGLGDFLQ